MRTLAVYFLILLFGLKANGQIYSELDKYSALDSIVRGKNIRTKNLKKLHRKLTGNLTSDELRARAFYIWVTENIAYDTKLYYDRHAQFKLNRKPLKSRLRRTLRKRSAICGGYAELFRELCRFSGIPAEVEMGYSKTRPAEINRRTRPDHGWNKVKIDGIWRMVDATWGAGSFAERRYYKQFKEVYFFTPSKKFYHNHFPLNKPLALKSIGFTEGEFFRLPVVHTGFFKWIKALKGNSKIGKQVIQVKDSLEITFQKESAIGVVRVYNGKQLLNYDVDHDNDVCRISVAFPEAGYYEPTIYLNFDAALTYAVYVRESAAGRVRK